MNRAKTSLIWKIDDKVFREIISSSRSYAEVMRRIKFAISSGSYKVLKSRIERDKIDCSHFDEGRKELSRSALVDKIKIPSQNIFVKNSTTSRSTAKRRLLDDGIIENRCSECGLQSDWNGKPIVLILDHINGVRDDNRIENLRFLCPNCNSQQNTFGSRNRRKKYFCRECGKETKGHSMYCPKCASTKSRKVVRPNREQLEQEIRENSWVALGRKYGVSDNAVRKWAKQYDII